MKAMVTALHAETKGLSIPVITRHSLAEARPEGKMKDSAEEPAAGLSVLVAEDNPVNQRLIRHMLESFGCRTMVVGNGREALAALTAEPGGHDLVVLDMHMPELDGIDVLRAIRSGAARCSPCSRRLATQPHTVTVEPTRSALTEPQRRSRRLVAS